MMIPCCAAKLFLQLLVNSVGEIGWRRRRRRLAAVVALLAVAAAGLAIGDAVGDCANKLVASAVEQIQRRTNFFIEVLCS